MKNVYIPIAEVAKELKTSTDKLYYFFKTHKEDAEKYLKVDITQADKNGKKLKRFYVHYSFIAYFEINLDDGCSQEDIKAYEEVYYKYVEVEELKLEEAGKSIASNTTLWKDMEIIDSRLSRLCILELEHEIQTKATSYQKHKIADIVYRHIFGKKFYLKVCEKTILKQLSGDNDD